MHGPLSIVVLNFRTPAQTVKALECAGATIADGPVEMIVVDNCSGDGSVETIKGLCSGARVVEMPSNLGFARGMNAGIRESSGDFVLLTNSDVEASGGSVQRLLSYMLSNPDVGLSAPSLVDGGGKRSRTLLLQPTLTRLLVPWVGKSNYRAWVAKVGSQALDVEATEGAAVMVRREAIRAAGLMDEDFFFYHEIVEWCARIRDRGFRIVVVPESVMTHHCGTSTKYSRRAARVELKRSEYQLIGKRLGTAARRVVIARDAVSELASVCFYAGAYTLSLGAWKRGFDKLSAHWAVWRWLAWGMPGCSDERYRKHIGVWD